MVLMPACALPVDFSAVQPRGSIDSISMSKSQKRRRRERQSAIKRSQHLSLELKQSLGGLVAKPFEAQSLQDPGMANGVSEVMEFVHWRLSSVEYKLDILLGNVCRSAHVESGPAPGVSAEVLAAQCAAVRKIQRWCRKLLSRPSTILCLGHGGEVTKSQYNRGSAGNSASEREQSDEDGTVDECFLDQHVLDDSESKQDERRIGEVGQEVEQTVCDAKGVGHSEDALSTVGRENVLLEIKSVCLQLDTLDDRDVDEGDDAYQILLRSLEDLAIIFRLGHDGRRICERAFAEIDALQQMHIDDENGRQRLQCRLELQNILPWCGATPSYNADKYWQPLSILQESADDVRILRERFMHALG
mmetsp:Transcript_28573/g.52443  ORF Transcript_28573/g.52443 Transcript_28573/m.52443 type:complete len:360 (+) Transcript_28573:120-1199(+)